MNYFCDARVGDVKLLIKKEDTEGVVFHNLSRCAAGFACFLSGEGKIDIEGVGCFPIVPGTFIRYKTGDRYFLDVRTPCTYYVSEIDITVNGDEAFPRVVVCNENELATMEKIYEKWIEQGEYCCLETRILLLRFLMENSKRIRSAPIGSQSFLSLALSYVHRRYNEGFTLAEIASVCKVSPSHLRNSFHAQYGISVMQYRENLRISQAKDMLKSGEHRMSEIAAFLGYCDVYHFSRKFKKATGVSPSRYTAR